MAFARLIRFGQSRKAQVLARASAVLFLALTISHGVMQGGVLEYEGSPWMKLPDKFSSLVGLAADDIRVNGLTHHDPELLLHALNLKPGDSLIGFDAGQARRMLEGMDWVAQASVQRKYPNILEINVVERVPFAIWQRGSSYYLIDKAGIAMGGLELISQSHFPLVTGEGANLGAAQLVNQLEAYPDLLKKVSAAAMVGKRRWTLFLDNGVKIALPEGDIVGALAKVSALDASQGLLSKGISAIDLRLNDRMVVALAEAVVEKKVGQK